MHSHPDIDDRDLLERFAANTLPAFPHEEHLHVVFVASATRDEAATLHLVREGIIAMATANGRPEAYHDTRTAAWTRLIVTHRTGFTGRFDDFLARHPELVRRDLLSDYYTDELLTSDAARQRFIAPDRQPLPTRP